jgi:hypothetical protein
MYRLCHLVFVAGATILSLLFSCPTFAQQIIIHSTFSFDDGDPVKDDDGARNGSVVWKGGAVHVVTLYEVYATTEFPNPVLMIRAGAIVKVAGTFSIGTNGGITWTPPVNTFIGTRGFNLPEANATIIIEGATITDIRDDTEGGDTNGDGNASSPNLWGVLRFSGSPRDVVNASTIKYCTIGHIGSMQFINNNFMMFGGVVPLDSRLDPIVLNASPKFIGNTFQRLAVIDYYALDLRGMTPIIDNNTFRDDRGEYAIRVGPARELQNGTFGNNIGPASGMIVISNNRIETKQGISLSAYGRDPDSLYSKGPTIRAEIHSNTLRAPINYGIGLQLAFAAEATVTNNDISNYYQPVAFFFDPQSAAGNRTQCALRINNNRFSTEGAHPTQGGVAWFPPRGSPAARNVLINMKNNYWGDATGPFDTTRSDGRSNPRGRGLPVGSNTIDYLPFVGGATPPQRDVVRLTVSSPSTGTPLAPNSSVTLNATVDFYDLVSAPTGRIVVLVRDADGIILNQPGTIVNVTSGNHTAAIPAIPFTVPALSNVVIVEANLVPDGEFEAVRSNLISYTVNLPPSSLQVSATAPTFVRGNTDDVRLNMTYTLSSTNPGTIELDFKERTVDNGTVLTTFPLITLAAPSGTNRTLAHTATLDIPLRGVDLRIKGEIVLVASLKTDAGVVVGQQMRVLSIDENANRVKIKGSVVGDYPTTVVRYHFTTGTANAYAVQYDYTIATRNITNWQVWLGFDRLLNASGVPIEQYIPPFPILTNASTGTSTGHSAKIAREISIPSEAKKYRIIIRLVGPAGIIAGLDSVDYPILAPVNNASRAVPAGPSLIAFTPITASLNFASNQKAGAAFAEEFAGQFGATAATSALAKTSASDFYWKFIPLKRYWAVYDTLKDGTFSATVSFTYDPATDFPNVPEFKEDSLVVAGFNPLSQELEALPSTLNKATHTITTAYTKFFDTYVVASKATVLTTAVSSRHDAEIPAQFSLSQNYPNPFNPATVISFQLPVNSHVTLKVFDLFGREIVMLVDKKYSAGRYDVHWDATGHASGVYFYRLVTEAGFVQTKKLLLMK